MLIRRLKDLTKTWSLSATRSRRPGARLCRLGVEVLEDRLTPTTTTLNVPHVVREGDTFRATVRVVDDLGTGVALGQVSLNVGLVQITAASLEGTTGTVTFTLTQFPGRYDFFARYTQGLGDSDSGVEETDVLALTSVKAAVPQPSVPFGQPVTLAATVLATDGDRSPVAGPVDFYVDGQPVGEKDITSSGDEVRLTLGTLSVGSHVLTAYYAGDPNIEPGTRFGYTSSPFSDPVSFTVTRDPTDLALSSSAASSSLGQPVTFTAAVTPRDASVPPTGSVVFSVDNLNSFTEPLNSSGTASLTLSSLGAGPHTIRAIYSGDNNLANSGNSVTVDVSPRVSFLTPPSQLSTEGMSSGQFCDGSFCFEAPPTGAVSAGNPFVLEALVSDAQGRPQAGVPVSFAAQPGQSGADATPSPSVVMTDARGIATVTLTANSNVGDAFTVTAQAEGGSATLGLSEGLPPAAAAFTANLVAPRPAGTPLPVAVGTPVPLVFQVLDGSGNPAAGQTIDFSTSPADASGAGATLSSSSVVTDADGIATVTLTADDAVGSYLLRASVRGGGPASTFSLINVVDAHASVAVVSGTPQNATEGTRYAEPLRVQVRDVFGNPVQGATVVFRSQGGLTAFDSPSALTGPDGIATVGASAIDTANTGVDTVATTVQEFDYLTGKTDGLSDPATFELASIPGSGAFLGITGGAGQHAVVGTPFQGGLKVVVSDEFGNPLPGALVAFTVQPGLGGAGGALSSGLAATDANGVASVGVTANDIPGSYRVTASLPGFPGTSATFDLTNDALGQATITLVGGSGQDAVVGTGFAAPLAVKVTDASGNPIPNALVTFAAPASGASAALQGSDPQLPSGVVRTDADGLAQVSATANTVAGSYSVTATVAGYSGSASIDLTNDPGSASRITLAGGSGQDAPISTAFASPLAVKATDDFGNPVSGVVVHFRVDHGSGAAAVHLSGKSAVTGPDGVASVTATAGRIAGPSTVTASFHLPKKAGGGSGSVSFQLTTDALVPAFDSLSAPSVVAGTRRVELTGHIGTGGLVPHGYVSVTLTQEVNGVIEEVTRRGHIDPTTGDFSVRFDTSLLPPGTYAVSYSFAGDARFAAADASSTLTITADPKHEPLPPPQPQPIPAPGHPQPIPAPGGNAQPAAADLVLSPSVLVALFAGDMLETLARRWG